MAPCRADWASAAGFKANLESLALPEDHRFRQLEGNIATSSIGGSDVTLLMPERKFSDVESGPVLWVLTTQATRGEHHIGAIVELKVIGEDIPSGQLSEPVHHYHLFLLRQPGRQFSIVVTVAANHEAETVTVELSVASSSGIVYGRHLDARSNQALWAHLLVRLAGFNAYQLGLGFAAPRESFITADRPKEGFMNLHSFHLLSKTSLPPFDPIDYLAFTIHDLRLELRSQVVFRRRIVGRGTSGFTAIAECKRAAGREEVKEVFVKSSFHEATLALAEAKVYRQIENSPHQSLLRLLTGFVQDDRTLPPSGGSGYVLRRHVGTTPFLSLNMLSLTNDVDPHSIYDDFESFFYVAVYYFLLDGDNSKVPAPSRPFAAAIIEALDHRYHGYSQKHFMLGDPATYFSSWMKNNTLPSRFSGVVFYLERFAVVVGKKSGGHDGLVKMLMAHHD
ncbi:hypothetical protein MNV49_003019 [Pseudohyphozyma bogoriensis]|nr:hypothetical protein MNV49_003019 [Pseudohyphozyma bogoriensis]